MDFNVNKILIVILSIICTPIILLYVCANIMFKEPFVDRYTSIIVTQFLWWDVAMLVIFIPMIVILAIFISRFVRENDSPKWAHLIWIALSVICMLQAKNIIYTILDITEKSYITYEGEFTQDNGGYSLDVKTTRLISEDVKLKSRASLIESGEYVGTVIYTKRSKIAVEVRETDSIEIE